MGTHYGVKHLSVHKNKITTLYTGMKDKTIARRFEIPRTTTKIQDLGPIALEGSASPAQKNTFNNCIYY